MNRVLTMTLSESSFEKARRAITSYKRQFRVKFDQAMLRLRQDAESILMKEISVAYIFDQNQDDHSVKVHSKYTPGRNGFILTMSGEAVGFIEFGTGEYADEQHMFREEAPFPVFSGSYSDTVGKGTWDAYIRSGAYSTNGVYWYNSKPTYPLYNTSRWIEQNWKKYFETAISEIQI